MLLSVLFVLNINRYIRQSVMNDSFEVTTFKKRPRKHWCEAVSWAEMYCGALGFVSSSDALFSFYICSRSRVEKVNFSEWLLPLTNGNCARDVISVIGVNFGR